MLSNEVALYTSNSRKSYLLFIVKRLFIHYLLHMLRAQCPAIPNLRNHKYLDFLVFVHSYNNKNTLLWFRTISKCYSKTAKYTTVVTCTDTTTGNNTQYTNHQRRQLSKWRNYSYYVRGVARLWLAESLRERCYWLSDVTAAFSPCVISRKAWDNRMTAVKAGCHGGDLYELPIGVCAVRWWASRNVIIRNILQRLNKRWPRQARCLLSFTDLQNFNSQCSRTWSGSAVRLVRSSPGRSGSGAKPLPSNDLVDIWAKKEQLCLQQFFWIS